jgi:putative transposase
MQNRGVQDIFIVSIDGLTGFSVALNAVFPQTEAQRCIIRQIRNNLHNVS